MRHKQYGQEDAALIIPLLRSIRREIRERTKLIAALEQRLEAFDATRHAHAEEVARLESDLSTHRRELRRVERELFELGCKQDQDSPLRILIPTRDGDFVCDGDLAHTAIRRMPTHARAS